MVASNSDIILELSLRHSLNIPARESLKTSRSPAENLCFRSTAMEAVCRDGQRRAARSFGAASSRWPSSSHQDTPKVFSCRMVSCSMFARHNLANRFGSHSLPSKRSQSMLFSCVLHTPEAFPRASSSERGGSGDGALACSKLLCKLLSRAFDGDLPVPAVAAHLPLPRVAAGSASGASGRVSLLSSRS